MIYEHGNRRTAADKSQMRQRFTRWREHSRGWGKRFRRRMLERARMQNVLREMEQTPPYCYLPSMFTRGYLRRTNATRVADLRAHTYLGVIAREIRHQGRRTWEPMVHERR